MRARLLQLTGAGILILGILAYAASRPETPSLSLLVSTEPVPTLLPHAHGAADKVSDGHHGVEARSLPITVPETMWVTEIRVDTTNMPRGAIHHLHVIRILPDGTRDFLKSSVFTVGQDTVPVVRFPAPSGILFRAGEQVAIDAVLHNPVPPLGEGGVYKDATVDVTLSGAREGEGRYLPIYFDLPRVTDSTESEDDDSTFEIPVGNKSFTRSSADNPDGSMGASHRFLSDGWIVYMGAHMHPWEGGERVDAYLNSKRIRTFTSRIIDPNVPWSFETEAGPALIRVKRGDTLTVSATYVNPYEVPIQGAMGMVGVYYVADQFSLNSPLYHLSWMLQGAYQTAKDAISASLP